MSEAHLTIAQARRIALWRQGLLGEPVGTDASSAPYASVRSMLKSLGAVQLDTISVLARSHELVAYARLGALPRSTIERGYWNGSSSFEYWSHAASILPMSVWPWFAFRRRHFVRRRHHWHNVNQTTVRAVLGRLESEGALTTTEFGGTRGTSTWWGWSDAKIAVEWLLNTGQVVCTRRTGWKRIYELAEHRIAEHLRVPPDAVMVDEVTGPADDQCLQFLVNASLQSLGIGTLSDIADVHRLTIGQVRAHLPKSATTVTVQGWDQPAYASGQALRWLSSEDGTASRSVLLSPFDSLIWHRDRTQRLFGMRHRLEAYTPAARRQFGYFAMPVLHEGQLVGRVDPARQGSTLIAKKVTFEANARGSVARSAIHGTARALVEAGRWTGCVDIVINEVVPARAAPALRAAVAASA